MSIKGKGTGGVPHPDAQILVSLLREVEPGGVVTYKALNSAIAGDVQGRSRSRLVTARRIAQNQHAITFGTLTNEGLRRLTSSELATSDAEKQTSSIGRKARRASKRLQCADQSELSSEEQVSLVLHSSVQFVVSHTTKKRSRARLEAKLEKSQAKAISLNETLLLFGDTEK
jgi:hypothetical protein